MPKEVGITPGQTRKTENVTDFEVVAILKKASTAFNMVDNILYFLLDSLSCDVHL